MEKARRLERGMQGLLPPRVTSLQAEVERAHTAIARCCTPLEKYQVSTSLNSDAFCEYRHVPLHSLCAREANIHQALSHIFFDALQAIMGLRESSWDIFYGLLSQHIKEYLPIIYTP